MSNWDVVRNCCHCFDMGFSGRLYSIILIQVSFWLSQNNFQSIFTSLQLTRLWLLIFLKICSPRWGNLWPKTETLKASFMSEIFGTTKIWFVRKDPVSFVYIMLRNIQIRGIMEPPLHSLGKVPLHRQIMEKY